MLLFVLKDCKYSNNDELLMLSNNVLYKLARVTVPLESTSGVSAEPPVLSSSPRSKKSANKTATNPMKSPTKRGTDSAMGDDDDNLSVSTPKMTITVRTDDDVIQHGTPIPNTDDQHSTSTSRSRQITPVHSVAASETHGSHTNTGPGQPNSSRPNSVNHSIGGVNVGVGEGNGRKSRDGDDSSSLDSKVSKGGSSSSIPGNIKVRGELQVENDLQKMPDMILMFRLSHTLFLSDPESPSFTENRMPQYLDVLDSEVVVITWTDGSYELLLLEVPFGSIDETLLDNTATINPARLRNLALQSLECHDDDDNDDDDDDDTNRLGKQSRRGSLNNDFNRNHRHQNNVMRRLLTVDAHLSVIQKPKLTLPRGATAAPIAPEFSIPGISCIHRLSWSTSLSGGAYLYEFITTGLDRRICHWGIRLTASPNAVTVEAAAAAATKRKSSTSSSHRRGSGDQSRVTFDKKSSQNAPKSMMWEADLLGVRHLFVYLFACLYMFIMAILNNIVLEFSVFVFELF